MKGIDLMLATRIKMYRGKESSNTLLEIDEIYLTGCQQPGYYKKEKIYNYLINNPGSIQVNRYPYPNLIPRISINEEKYVSSSPNDSTADNLLKLPQD